MPGKCLTSQLTKAVASAAEGARLMLRNGASPFLVESKLDGEQTCSLLLFARHIDFGGLMLPILLP